MNDNLDTLLSDLHYIDSGWHRVVHTVTGAVVLILPAVPNHPHGSAKACAAEDEWQQRSIEMHASQEALTLAPKPLENTLAARVVRAD